MIWGNILYLLAGVSFLWGVWRLYTVSHISSVAEQDRMTRGIWGIIISLEKLEGVVILLISAILFVGGTIAGVLNAYSP